MNPIILRLLYSAFAGAAGSGVFFVAQRTFTSDKAKNFGKKTGKRWKKARAEQAEAWANRHIDRAERKAVKAEARAEKARAEAEIAHNHAETVRNVANNGGGQ